MGENKAWACYHTKLFEFEYESQKIGFIARATGRLILFFK
jgi:hypothetical protein